MRRLERKNYKPISAQKQRKAKTFVLSSGKIDQYEYFTGEEILPPNRSQIRGKAKFVYFPLGKALEKK